MAWSEEEMMEGAERAQGGGTTMFLGLEEVEGGGLEAQWSGPFCRFC